jgi:hypothetical protein
MFDVRATAKQKGSQIMSLGKITFAAAASSIIASLVVPLASSNTAAAAELPTMRDCGALNTTDCKSGVLIAQRPLYGYVEPGRYGYGFNPWYDYPWGPYAWSTGNGYY